MADDSHRTQRQDYGNNGQPQRQQGGDDRAEQGQQNDQRDRNADPLSVLQVFRTQLVVLEGHAGVAADEHPKAVHPVLTVDYVNDILDVLRRLFEVPGQDKAQYGGPTVGRHQNRVVGQVIVGDYILG